MRNHLFALLVSLLLGLLLPHPFGLILMGAMALGGAWRAGDRVSGLEAIVRDRRGVEVDEYPSTHGDGYTAERARIRAHLKKFPRQAEEEKQ